LYTNCFIKCAENKAKKSDSGLWTTKLCTLDYVKNDYGQAGSGLCITSSGLWTQRSSCTHLYIIILWIHVEDLIDLQDLDSRDVERKSKAISTKKHQITICLLISSNMVKPIWNVLPTVNWRICDTSYQQLKLRKLPFSYSNVTILHQPYKGYKRFWRMKQH
jgi:hypothetical protein